MKILSFLNPLRWWRQWLRNIDHKTLFPIIRQRADNEQLAAAAILVHCANDEAWECDPTEYSERDTSLIVASAKLIPTTPTPETP